MPAIVDIHCHTFNGADLPIEGFVRHVALRASKWPKWVNDRLARRADRMVQKAVHGYEPERTSLQTLLDEPQRGIAPAESDGSEEANFYSQVERDIDALIEEDPETAEYLGVGPGVETMAIGPSEARAFFQFARNLASSRLDIARRLVETYPTVNVFTPMLVDMSLGVDDEPLTTVEEQIDLHEKISRLSILRRLTQQDALILPFIGFDPRRKVESSRALDLVFDAVENKGFAGVKLYPPMGFFPIQNAEPGIDECLTALYDWCERESVPITVHCNRSQGAKDEANDERSDPKLWGAVLEKHPDLHLNLGHFGGIKGADRKPFWPEEISKLATFANVYADLGCHADLLEEDGRTAYKSVLNKLFAGAGRAMCDRLMYGSDWSMLLQHPGFEGYLDAVSSAFPKAEHERLLGGRALDFLGLGATPNRNGVRVFTRIKALGADPRTWISDGAGSSEG
jgi:predicted TIM-barrel fold metal-dependent hydrolase